jgi:hypothetical protein
MQLPQIARSVYGHDRPVRTANDVDAPKLIEVDSPAAPSLDLPASDDIVSGAEDVNNPSEFPATPHGIHAYPA